MQVERVRVQPDPFSPLHAQRMAQWRQRIWDAVQAARTQMEFYIAGTMQTTQDSGYLSMLGWHAIHDGQLKQAQEYFRAALHYDPYSIRYNLCIRRNGVANIGRHPREDYSSMAAAPYR